MAVAAVALLVPFAVAVPAAAQNTDGGLDGYYEGALVLPAEVAKYFQLKSVDLDVDGVEVTGEIQMQIQFEGDLFESESLLSGGNLESCARIGVSIPAGVLALSAEVPEGVPGAAASFSGTVTGVSGSSEGLCTGSGPALTDAFTGNLQGTVVETDAGATITGSLSGGVLEDTALPFEASRDSRTDDDVAADEVDDPDEAELRRWVSTLCRTYGKQVGDKACAKTAEGLPTRLAKAKNPIERARLLADEFHPSRFFGSPMTTLKVGALPLPHLTNFLDAATSTERRVVSARAINNWIRALMELTDAQLADAQANS